MKQKININKTVIPDKVTLESAINMTGDLVVEGCVKGDIFNNGIVTVKGMVIGNIEAMSVLIIGGTVKGNIASSNDVIVALGNVDGDITCNYLKLNGCCSGNVVAKEKAEIMQMSEVDGNLTSGEINVEDINSIKGLVQLNYKLKMGD